MIELTKIQEIVRSYIADCDEFIAHQETNIDTNHARGLTNVDYALDAIDRYEQQKNAVTTILRQIEMLA